MLNKIKFWWIHISVDKSLKHDNDDFQFFQSWTHSSQKSTSMIMSTWMQAFMHTWIIRWQNSMPLELIISCCTVIRKILICTLVILRSRCTINVMKIVFFCFVFIHECNLLPLFLKWKMQLNLQYIFTSYVIMI